LKFCNIARPIASEGWNLSFPESEESAPVDDYYFFFLGAYYISLGKCILGGCCGFHEGIFKSYSNSIFY